MNLIPVIRERLGLQENEEFRVRCGTAYVLGRYRFTKDRLEHFDVRYDCWAGATSDLFAKLVHGIYEVDKPPFKPKEAEVYYYVGLYNGEIFGTPYSQKYAQDVMRINSGNCYRTREDAEKHSDEWMSKVYGENWKELLK